MSSSPRADRPFLRMRSPRTWSLRTRLLVTQVGLLALVCACIGVGTVLALQSFLIHQLDERLAETGRRSAGLFEFGPPPPPPVFPPTPGHPRRIIVHDDLGPGPAFLNAPGQAARTVGAGVSRGMVVAAASRTSATMPSLATNGDCGLNCAMTSAPLWGWVAADMTSVSAADQLPPG